MQSFLLLFRNASGDGQYIASAEDMAKDLPLWQAWVGGLAAAGRLIDTKPIDYAGQVLRPGGLHDGPFLAEGQVLAGYLLCRAENAEAMAGEARQCPILRYPQGSVEIRPISSFEF